MSNDKAKLFSGAITLHNMMIKVTKGKAAAQDPVSKVMYNQFQKVCIVHSVHCTLYIVHSVHYTLCIVDCTLYIVHCTLYIVHTVHCTDYHVYNVQGGPIPKSNVPKVRAYCSASDHQIRKIFSEVYRGIRIFTGSRNI